LKLHGIWGQVTLEEADAPPEEGYPSSRRAVSTDSPGPGMAQLIRKPLISRMRIFHFDLLVLCVADEHGAPLSNSRPDS
jgi:hypothetical protein